MTTTLALAGLAFALVLIVGGWTNRNPLDLLLSYLGSSRSVRPIDHG